MCSFLLIANSNLFPSAKTFTEFERFKDKLIEASECISGECHWYYEASGECKLNQLTRLEDIYTALMRN
jgi:hypothetical protein